jgi:signal transduction histidine kinase
MSHEIRTPLNAVLGIGQLLAETTQLTLEQQQYMSMISNSGHLLLTIINDVSGKHIRTMSCHHLLNSWIIRFVRLSCFYLAVGACVISLFLFAFSTLVLHVHQILDLSKIEAGQLSLSLTPANLVDIVENALMLVYGQS